jgi:integrase
MSVNLTKRVKTPDGKRYCPVVTSANGRIKPNYVVVEGREESHPEGSYYLDWNHAGKRTRVSVGRDAALAFSRKLRKETELRAVQQGIVLAPTPDNRTDLGAAITAYLEEIKMTKKHGTWWEYQSSLKYFQESCAKRYVDELERTDMLKFSAFLRDKKGLSPRTCRNKFGNVMVFLRVIEKNTIVKKNDWPRFTMAEVEVYEKEDLDRLFAACTPEERLVYEFFLMSGMREQELAHCAWRDINFNQGSVTMRWKPEYLWSPKAYKEREIPIPAKLMDKLREVRPKNAKGLIFPTDSGRPQQNFLIFLKAIAKRAKLDPEEFYLHKFRSTFCTWHLRNGVDLRTVQQWMGHTDLKSTLRYLQPARGQGVQDKVNATFA